MAPPLISVIILAAGNSGRMGREKALLPYGNGLTFAEQLLCIFTEFGCDPVTMVVNKNFTIAPPGTGRVNYVVNHQVERGRSHSLWLGLQNTPPGQPCFLQNIDNPFIETDLLSRMCTAIRPEGYVVPVSGGKGGHPILLGNYFINHLLNREEAVDLRKTLKKFRRIEVSWHDERILWNINSPDDYDRFMRWPR